MFKKILENTSKKSPVIHNITNYVTVNDCANIQLALSASPIMADDPFEVADITFISSALNINIGTLNKQTIESMLISGKLANNHKIPVVFDPVGTGASSLRTDTSFKILNNTKLAVIRGNASEIKTLAIGKGSTKGVDVSEADIDSSLESLTEVAKDFSKKIKAVVAVTGATDIVTDGEKTYTIYNGNPLMSKVTGTGCMLSAVISAFIGANPNDILTSTAAAVCTMGICGEKAFERMSKDDGNSSYRNYIIDAAFTLNGNELERRAKYEVK